MEIFKLPTPSDPNKILIIGNKQITTGKIYEYYLSVKDKIIKECDLRPVLLFNKYDTKNDFTVVRKYKDGPIILTKNNYEEIISGYTISISVESEYPGKYLKQKLIDVDSRNPKIKEDLLKQCVFELSELYKNYKYHITNSSTGYHFRVDINKAQSNKILQITFNELQKELSYKYTINVKQKGTTLEGINLDLSPMYNRGSLTVPYSLNRNLSICSYIDIHKLNSFDRSSIFLK